LVTVDGRVLGQSTKDGLQNETIDLIGQAGDQYFVVSANESRVESSERPYRGRSSSQFSMFVVNAMVTQTIFVSHGRFTVTLAGFRPAVL
jgi:hypothetical protein